MPLRRAPLWRCLADSPLPVLALIALAGNTDALVMMHGKPLLAVYMTGDSTRLGAALLHGAGKEVGALLCLIACFVAGTTLAAWLGVRAPAWRPAIALTLTAVLIALAIPHAGDDWPLRSTALIATAMGALNEARADQPGVTFITGALIKAGRDLAVGHAGAAARSAARWLAWLAGAIAGVSLDARFGTGALVALALCALAGAAMALLGRVRPASPANAKKAARTLS